MRVHVSVPATSANLGPGFDTLGLALTLYNEVGASEAEGVSVAIEAYEAAGRRFTGCALECTNRVPAARGLGSSAAAWVGGLVAGNALLGSPLTKDALLALAARAEGHPDNVAAALFGGLTVSSASGPTVTAVSLPVPAGLRWVALIPEVTSATAQARAVLPASVPYHDAVFNVQRVALLLASLWAGRPAALAAALEDRLHEPYRLRLFPWMPEVVRAARAAGALGCVLSGAGPSLLAVVAGDDTPVAAAMEAALRRAGMAGAARRFDVDTAGAVSRVIG